MSDSFGEVEFFGEKFRTNDPDECQWAMLEFAEAATDADSETLAGLASVMRFLKVAIVAEDWARFQKSARRNKAQVKRDLMPIIVAIFTGETGRPTSRSSDSSDGPQSMTENSADGSSSPDEAPYLRVVKRLEAEGRPDQAYIVLKAQQAAAASVA